MEISSAKELLAKKSVATKASNTLTLVPTMLAQDKKNYASIASGIRNTI